MPTPKAFSFSSLDTFLSCPRKYKFVTVDKLYDDPPGEQQLWGTKVHKHFEDYIKRDTPLPAELAEHADYMAKLKHRPGVIHAERKVALNIKCQPTAYFAKDVWWRGVIDYTNKDDKVSRIADYKTGKFGPKPLQLHLCMLYEFAEGAEECHAEFYWTQTRTTTPIVFPRSHSPSILRAIKPQLAEYCEAWHKDIWQPRPSGLCKRHCPVKACEFYGRGK